MINIELAVLFLKERIDAAVKRLHVWALLHGIK